MTAATAGAGALVYPEWAKRRPHTSPLKNACRATRCCPAVWRQGGTHQIRIHLSEAGHPVCGDKVYAKLRDGSMFEDRSAAPRLALHAIELGFKHPATEAELHWTMPLPADLAKFLQALRGG